jgi:F-box/WD-40 domain protein 5
MFIPSQVLRGHRGYTPSGGAFYLYVDVSTHLVGSGSEDLKAYVWDRRYGCVVSTLPHDKCVNCIAFNPIDDETCVTASDDNMLKVWTSRRVQRQQ